MKWLPGVAGIAVGLLAVAALLALVAVGPRRLLPLLLEPTAQAPTPTADLTGLQRPLPPVPNPQDNPTTPEKVELGRQLFYDPVLSASQAMSCATCHQPAKGFSNGASVSTARPGAPPRNVMTLWNSGINRFLLWDGREFSLESQAVLPLTLSSEMASDPQDLETRLRAIPAYVALFDTAFGGGQAAVTFDHVTDALAAFQRTLISDQSPYDRYVAGDSSALTSAQQRGLGLFLSDTTHCAECHKPPAFSLENFRVIGVDSPDPGRAAVSGQGIFGAFKVPTLRNVALTAPYMHDGSFATLEEVVDFYARGAGRANGFARVDPLLQGFDLTDQDRADLVAFLHALTDESKLPPVPDVALSGLPVNLP
jgi:cytochrome c peroxidase